VALQEMGTASQDSTGYPCRCQGCPRITFVPLEPHLCGPCSVGNHGHPGEHRCPATDIVDKLAAYIGEHYQGLITEGRDPADIAVILINRGRLLTEEPVAYGENPIVRLDSSAAKSGPQNGDPPRLED
jgi:hypothetical protein